MRPSRRSTIAGERPLTPAERSALVATAATTTLLFYVVATAVSIALLALCTVLVIILVVAARLGASGFIAPIVEREWLLLKIVVRSLWLPKPVNYRLKIEQREAPRLFALLTRLSTKMGVRPPDEVFVEMNNGAWVQLKGLVRGRGTTLLGVGYDLLAGLPEHEVEAVLAHEMAHAGLVNRGLSGWMNRTLGRLVRMTSDLRTYTLERKEKGTKSLLGEVLFQLCDMLTRRSVRLVATYSRQDEFEADAGAAEACGPAAIRWALVHLERLSADLERLPWAERLARLETDESFSRWLVGALAQERVKPRSQMRDAVDAFSTHPSLRDRIRALGADDSVSIPGRPGIELLDDPDRVASQLVTTIQRTAAREERKDDYELQEQIRKIQNPSHSNLWGVIGVAFIIFALLGGVATLAGGNDTSLFFLVVLGTLGGLIARKAMHRDRRKLPIPSFGALTWKHVSAEEFAAAEQSIETDLRGRFEPAGFKTDVNGMIEASYAALGEMDYLTAHVAARLALDKEKKNVDAALALGVAAAALGNAKQSIELHEWVRQFTGWRSDNVKWGVAWARCLLEDWATTEALLAQLVEKRQDQPTFQSLLGFAKIARGKIRTAEAHFRKAAELEPSNRFHIAQLASLYLDSGRLLDAEQIISPMRDAAAADVQVAALFLRMALLRRHEADAAQWADIVESLDPDPFSYVKFGFLFESARFDDRARAYFERALGAGHFPEAHIGLARLQTAAGDRADARKHLLEALNAERDRPATAQSPLALLHDIIGQLNNLEDERVQCRAWIATVPLQAGGPLAGASMFVCAPEELSAAAHLDRVLSSLYPTSGMTAGRLHWKEAPDETQPVRPIAPGVLHFTPAMSPRNSRP
jgi:Zn-dependent protease with chaperone function/tetratricopeptide (TPR) repeat protein